MHYVACIVCSVFCVMFSKSDRDCSVANLGGGGSGVALDTKREKERERKRERQRSVSELSE